MTDEPIEKEKLRSQDELESSKRMDINSLRNKVENHTFFIEFENTDDVIKCIIKKSIPWQKMKAARKRAKNVIKKADGTITAEIDQNELMRDLWNDIVVETQPKITATDLDTFAGPIAAEIISKVFNEHNKFASSITIRKK